MKSTFLKQIEINSAGGLRISAYKQFFDGDILTFEEPHLITISPLEDFDAIIAANNDHLAAMGYTAISADQLALAVALRKTAFADPLVSTSIVSQKAAATQAAKDEADALAAQVAAEEQGRLAAIKAEQDDAKARQAQAEAQVKLDAEKAAQRAADLQDAIDVAVAKALAAKSPSP